MSSRTPCASFAPDTGASGQGGRLFGRQAFVGLSGAWGTVSLGRDAVNAGPSPGGTNCAGENAADTKACREWSMLVKYDAASWGTALAVDKIRGGAGAFAGLTSSALSDTRVTLNGYAKVGATKIGGDLIHRDNEASAATPKSDLWYIGVVHPLTAQLTIDAQFARLSVKDSPNRATLAAVRGTYSLSKRSAIYATAGRIANDGTLALSISTGAPGSNPAAGRSQSAVMVGLRHAF